MTKKTFSSYSNSCELVVSTFLGYTMIVSLPEIFFIVTVTNTLAYFADLKMAPLRFYNTESATNVMKLFTAVSYEFLQKARVFLLGKPFLSSLTYASLAPKFVNYG